MKTFFNEKSRPLIFPGTSDCKSFELFPDENIAVTTNQFPLAHIFNLPHYFSSENNLIDILEGILTSNLHFTLYLNLHPLQDLENLALRNLINKYPQNYNCITNPGYSHLIDLENFSDFNLSKSIKHKIHKYKNHILELTNLSEFYSAYVNFFNQKLPYTITLDAIDNFDVYKISCEDGSLFLVLGLPKLKKNIYPCVEYLFSCSTSNFARNLTSVAIYQLIPILIFRGYKFLNLGGGISPGDKLETFKSWFGGKPILNRKINFASNLNTYIESGGILNSSFFPSYK